MEIPDYDDHNELKKAINTLSIKFNKLIEVIELLMKSKLESIN